MACCEWSYVLAFPSWTIVFRLGPENEKYIVVELTNFQSLILVKFPAYTLDESPVCSWYFPAKAFVKTSMLQMHDLQVGLLRNYRACKTWILLSSDICAINPRMWLMNLIARDFQRVWNFAWIFDNPQNFLATFNLSVKDFQLLSTYSIWTVRWNC